MWIFKGISVTSKNMGDNLRAYSRLLTSQLRAKEEELVDLKSRFSILENRFAQLDYAFKKNLQLHQQQIIEIYELRNSQKELRRVDGKRWTEFRELEERLMRVTGEKETAQKELVHWKEATIDEKKFHEGKYEELIKSYDLKLQEERKILEKETEETERRSKIQIQELENLKRAEEEKTEAMRKKAIVLQGDVDVLKYRTKELAHLFETLPKINESSKAISFRIVEVLRSFDLSSDEYDHRFNELRAALIGQNSTPIMLPQKFDTSSDDETLKEQNLVLREVVKKLKNDLSKLKKSEADRVAEEKSGQMRENEEQGNLIPSKNYRMRKLGTEIADKFETGDNEGGKNVCVNLKDKFVQTDETIVGYYGAEESRESENRKSFKACWIRRENRAKKIEERASRDEINNSELNFRPFDYDERTFDGKNAAVKYGEKLSENTDGHFDSAPDVDCPGRRFEPVESHLNSIRYKEYTISFSRKDILKIRHPIRSNEGIFQLLSVRSEEEYENTPADKAVLYFDFENVSVAPFPKGYTRSTNCSSQTLPIETANVFSQTIMSKELLPNLAGTGVKILNSEQRAIERSLRDLERTVSEVSKETLEEARAFIVSSTKFPPSEEFFDCIQYLSKS